MPMSRSYLIMTLLFATITLTGAKLNLALNKRKGVVGGGEPVLWLEKAHLGNVGFTQEGNHGP
jgi:hypothetical protein